MKSIHHADFSLATSPSNPAYLNALVNAPIANLPPPVPPHHSYFDSTNPTASPHFRHVPYCLTTLTGQWTGRCCYADSSYLLELEMSFDMTSNPAINIDTNVDGRHQFSGHGTDGI